MSETVGERTREMLVDVYALMLALKDSRVPWYAKAIASITVGYAFSPIDLIPDFIPVAGQLDDLVIIPFGVWLTVRLIPSGVMDELRIQAKSSMEANKPTSWLAGLIIAGTWALIIVAVVQKLRAHR